MKKIINEELSMMKYLTGYKRGVVISEQESTTTDVLGKANEVAKQMDVDVNVSDVVDPENPTCLPTTGDSEKDGIISKIWDWAHNPANKGSLKSTLINLKNAIGKAKQMEGKTEMQEQVVPLITIAGVALTPSLLIAIGVILLVIIVISISSGGKKNKSACSRRRKLVKKFGMDGNFMESTAESFKQTIREMIDYEDNPQVRLFVPEEMEGVIMELGERPTPGTVIETFNDIFQGDVSELVDFDENLFLFIDEDGEKITPEEIFEMINDATQDDDMYEY
jgi:hypothetical protein